MIYLQVGALGLGLGLLKRRNLILVVAIYEHTDVGV